MSRTVRRSSRGEDQWWKVNSRPKGRFGCGSKGEAPSWWTRMFDNVPKRRRDKAICKSLLQGADPDAMDAGVIDRRTHCYYW